MGKEPFVQKLMIRLIGMLAFTATYAKADVVDIDTVAALADYAAKSGNTVRMKPGVYRMADYLTNDVVDRIKAEVPQAAGRTPVWMVRFVGSHNRFDLTGVTLEIDTSLYRKLPAGYHRSLFMPGTDNTLVGLTVRHTGANEGSNGNTFSVWGSNNVIEDVTLHVFGSSPYGYGDLLGKGGPNLVSGAKQSGMMIAGQNNTLRRCRVISRAFGHCFYIQNPNTGGPQTSNIRLEDCYAEGVMRSTADMLREPDGPLAGWNYRTIAENRDGRFMVVPGYMKALGEDGFRTYGGTGKVELLNCTAINTRAGFEIAGPSDGDAKTLINGGQALGCERAYLIGSNTIVRRSRGDTKYGPLLYLRGGQGSDIDLELVGDGSDYTVHALATLAGENHRVRVFTEERQRQAPSVSILLGFGMPANAEMASPIRPALAENIRLINELDRFVVIRGEQAIDCDVQTRGLVLTDADASLPPKRPAPATTQAR